MFGNRANFAQTKTYLTAFTTLFNDIKIIPASVSGVPSKEMVVPITYAPREKWLSIIRQDPDKDSPAIVLPRMAVEMTGWTYDAERNMQTPNRNQIVSGKAFYSPAPYRIDLTLSVITKYHEDAFCIIEQILPYFRPKLSVKLTTLGDRDKLSTMAVTLNSVTPEETFEGSFDERRVIIYTMSFTITANYWSGNTSPSKPIKKATANMLDMQGNFLESLTIYPGMTSSGTPTTNPAETIPYTEIEETDDYALIVEYVEQ